MVPMHLTEQITQFLGHLGPLIEPWDDGHNFSGDPLHVDQVLLTL